MKFKIHVPNISDQEIIGTYEDAIEAFEGALWEAHFLSDEECLTTADMGLPSGAPLESLLEAKGFLSYEGAFVEVIQEEA